MIKISKATINDAYDLARIHVDSWKQAYLGIIPSNILDNLSYKKREQYFKQVIDNNQEENVLIYLDNQAVGFMCYGKCRDQDLDNAGEIWGIYLLKEYWHLGLGSKLLRYGVNDLRNRGFKVISLWVLEENTQARKFYEKHGFRFDGTKKTINIGKELIEIRYIMKNN